MVTNQDLVCFINQFVSLSWCYISAVLPSWTWRVHVYIRSICYLSFCQYWASGYCVYRSPHIKWALTKPHRDIQLKGSNSQTINTRGPSGKVAITRLFRWQQLNSSNGPVFVGKNSLWRGSFIHSHCRLWRLLLPPSNPSHITVPLGEACERQLWQRLTQRKHEVSCFFFMCGSSLPSCQAC